MGKFHQWALVGLSFQRKSIRFLGYRVPALFLRSKMWDLCAQVQHDSDRNAVPEPTKPEDTLDRSTDVQLWSLDNPILRNTEIERENANGKGCYKIWNKINGITWVCKKWNVVLKMNHKQNVSSKSDVFPSQPCWSRVAWETEKTNPVWSKIARNTVKRWTANSEKKPSVWSLGEWEQSWNQKASDCQQPSETD